jgi:hypothetical protein
LFHYKNESGQEAVNDLGPVLNDGTNEFPMTVPRTSFVYN